jgi:DNA-binding CsgD family transcriptional regulator
MDDCAHKLIDTCYAAALEPERWQEVAELVSERFGGSPVTLGFILPGSAEVQYYTVGVDHARQDTYAEHLLAEGRWTTRFTAHFADRFGQIDEVMAEQRIEDTILYRDWLKPQGFGPIWPVGHTIVDDRGTPIGGFVLFRREGEGDFDPSAMEAMQPFVPHFRRATMTWLALQGAQQVRGALAEAMDLLPTGLILLDERRNIVLKNRGADRILKLNDGIRADGGGPSLEDARQNAEFQSLIADAIESSRGGQAVSTGFLAVKRPSAKQAFATMVAPLLGNSSQVMGGAVVAIFIADPVGGRLQDPEVLASLYSLTNSEAELVRLLADGLSLEEVATKRGVSMNTARSHLKHVFAKTGTSRQGELVRLIIAGAGSIGEE